MRGITFQRPFEFSLLVEGESWLQGDTIQGTLQVKNHGNEAMPLAGMRVSLAEARLSKVKQKDPKAFDVLSSVEMDASRTVAPGAQESLSWRFPLDRNCQITAKSESLFLLYGQGEALEKLGQLQLQVQPDRIIQDYLATIQATFRFVVKGMRSSSKGWVEIKLEPPSAKAYSVIEGLNLSARFKDDLLRLRYSFTAKKIDASAGMKLSMQKKDFEQELAKTDYLTSSGRFQHARMEAAFQEMLAELGLGAVNS